MQLARDYDVLKNVTDRPIVVFDVSGSVDEYTIIRDSNTNTNKKIIDKLVDLLKEVAISEKFKTAHIIVFGLSSQYIGIKAINDITSTALWSEYDVGRSTDLATAIRLINQQVQYWYVNKTDNVMTVPIYILTDGEVTSDRDVLGKEIIQLCIPLHPNHKIRYDLRMLIFERNNKDYAIQDCTSGNIIVSVIRETTLSNTNTNQKKDHREKPSGLQEKSCMSEEEACAFIKYIYFCNERYQSLSDKFINTYNVDLPNGYIQYDDKCFHFKNYAIFLADITKSIGNLRTKLGEIEENEIEENKIEEENNNFNKNAIRGQLEKIGYNLIKTIKGLEKIATETNGYNFNKRQLIDFFCNLIGIESISDALKRELIYGVDNATFQEYKTRRAKLFNRTQINMYNNLRASITHGTPRKYISFIENNNVYDIETLHVEHTINMGFREYKHAGVFDIVTNKLIPVLPVFGSYNRSNYQAIRQWIRAIYSKRFGIPASSDLIHYTFLIDNLYVQVSNDIPNNIKRDYRELTKVMLDRVRYGESIKEIVYLSNHHPKPVGSKDDFWDFITKCPNYPTGISHEYLEPKFVWRMITCMIDQDTFRFQTKYCGDFDGDYSKEHMNIMSILSETKQIPKLKKLSVSTIIDPNYYCFVTLADTSETGGYMFYPHESYQKKNNMCAPSYVISEEAMNYYKNKNTNKSNVPILRCPHCFLNLDTSKMKPMIPRDEYEQTNEYIMKNKQNRKIYRNVRIFDEFSDELIELNKLDFSNNYRHRIKFEEHVILGNMMDSYGVMRFETADKQSEFNERVPKFLFGINMTNVVVAGGMIRSILLGQKIQDIDLFFVGLNEEQVKSRIITLINDIIAVLQKEDPDDYRFILMYKPLNSVVELLCTRSTFDESLYDDDEKVINEKTLFIHNDVIHKIQIILRSHDSINDIFDNFDMFGSCVVFDGSKKKTYFTEASYVAFKYMVNMIDPLKSGHVSYNSRILKYYRYGFAIGLSKAKMPPNALEKLENSPKTIKISGCVFETIDICPDQHVTNPDKEFKDLDPIRMREQRTNYIPIESFKLEKKKNNPSKKEETEEGEITIPAPAMYESYDDVDAAGMIGLYNYMIDNEIKYCYLMGEVCEEEISDVFDVQTVEFLKNKRDTTFDWYSPAQILITSKS